MTIAITDTDNIKRRIVLRRWLRDSIKISEKTAADLWCEASDNGTLDGGWIVDNLIVYVVSWGTGKVDMLINDLDSPRCRVAEVEPMDFINNFPRTTI